MCFAGVKIYICQNGFRFNTRASPSVRRSRVRNCRSDERFGHTLRRSEGNYFPKKKTKNFCFTRVARTASNNIRQGPNGETTATNTLRKLLVFYDDTILFAPSPSLSVYFDLIFFIHTLHSDRPRVSIPKCFFLFFSRTIYLKVEIRTISLGLDMVIY